MATYRFELNDKPSRNGKYAVFLRVTVNGKRKKFKTPVEVNRKSDWNPTPKGDNWIRPSEPNSKVWNQTLSKTIEKAKKTYEELANNGAVTSEKLYLELIQNQMYFHLFPSQSLLQKHL